MTMPSLDTHAAQEGKMGEWISVEDRLPELDQRILAWRDVGGRYS